MSQLYKALPQVLDQRRTDVDRIDDIAGGVTKYIAFVIVERPGELLANVNFPVMFLEEPAFSAGMILLPNSPISNGNFPTYSATVGNWKFQMHLDTGAKFYVGASVLFVVTGPSGTAAKMSCQFEAMALRNPIQ